MFLNVYFLVKMLRYGKVNLKSSSFRLIFCSYQSVLLILRMTRTNLKIG